MTARDWAGFFGLAVLWGIPYLFIKIAVDDGVPPIFLAWIRVVLAATLLLALAARAGTLSSVGGLGRWMVLYAIIEICLPFPLIGFGETHVSSSLAAILIATVPAIVVLMSRERLNRTRTLGLVLGFAGVVALVGIDVAGDDDELLGAGAILLAAVGYSAGPLIYQRRFGSIDVRAAMGWALAAAAVVLTPFAWIDPPDTVTADAGVAIVVLATACTAAAFALFAHLINTIGASRTAIITYVAPIVAVIAGVLVLEEEVGPGALAGLVLILAGSWLATGGRSKAVAAPDDLPHDLVGAPADGPQPGVPQRAFE